MSYTNLINQYAMKSNTLVSVLTGFASFASLEICVCFDCGYHLEGRVIVGDHAPLYYNSMIRRYS